MDLLEHRCAVSADLTLAHFLAPASRTVMLSAQPTLVVERRDVSGHAMLHHTLTVGFFHRSWDAAVLSEDEHSLVAEGAEGFTSFRHELSLVGGSLHSLVQWEGSDLSAELSQARVAVPLGEEASASLRDERPTTRIVLGARSAAA